MSKIHLIIIILLLIFNFNTIFSQLNPFQIQQENKTENAEDYDYEKELERSKYNLRYGLFLGYGLNFHHTNFSELPNYPTCCDAFKSGFGHGINFGASVQHRLNKDWYVGSKLLISNSNGKLKFEGTEPITVSGILQTAKIGNIIDASINTLVLSPYVAYSVEQVSEDFQVLAGLNLGFITKANFTQYEELISPSVGTFENGYRIRNNVTAELPNKNILFGLSLGVQYDLPLNKNMNWKWTPEFKYNFWLTSPVSSLNWFTSQLSFGVSLRYNKPPNPPPPPPDPILPPLPPMRLPSLENNLIVDVNHSITQQNPDGTYSETDEIMVEEYSHSNLKPLLNYIFFDSMSDVIPSRYKQIDTNKMFADEYRNFSNMNSLETYYYLLDIVGFRLRKYAKATIELVGTNTGNGAERNNLNLSERRANSIKKYLIDTWGIEDFRIKTTARNLPKDPTRPTEGAGNEENRRVEIYSNDSRITDPILSFDTISVIKTPYIKFIPSVNSPFGIESANFVLKRGSVLCDSVLDANLSPLEVEITNEIINSNTHFPFTYQLTATDKMEQKKSSKVKQINIYRVTVESKKSDNIADTNYEYFSLILFEFNSTSLGEKNNKVIDYIKTRIQPESKIIVSGYTDIIGLPEANKRIATERAAISAKRLGIEDVELRGIGTDELLYDNKYPEGRFYCRTVTIYIATPVSND